MDEIIRTIETASEFTAAVSLDTTSRYTAVYLNNTIGDRVEVWAGSADESSRETGRRFAVSLGDMLVCANKDANVHRLPDDWVEVVNRHIAGLWRDYGGGFGDVNEDGVPIDGYG